MWWYITWNNQKKPNEWFHYSYVVPKEENKVYKYNVIIIHSHFWLEAMLVNLDEKYVLESVHEVLAKVSIVDHPKRAFKFKVFTILQTLNGRMVYNNMICYCVFITNYFDLKVSNLRTIDWSHVQIGFNVFWELSMVIIVKVHEVYFVNNVSSNH